MYLSTYEKIPVRKTQSKKYMVKVMFLVAVEIPRRYYKRNRFLYGKLGYYTLVEKKEAKRNIIKG